MTDQQRDDSAEADWARDKSGRFKREPELAEMAVQLKSELQSYLDLVVAIRNELPPPSKIKHWIKGLGSAENNNMLSDVGLLGSQVKKAVEALNCLSIVEERILRMARETALGEKKR